MADDHGWIRCDFCHRDTKNKSRICKACMRGVRKHSPPKRNYLANPDEYEAVREFFGLDDYGRDEAIRRDVARAMIRQTE